MRRVVTVIPYADEQLERLLSDWFGRV